MSISLEFLQDLLREEHPDVTILEFEGAPGSKRGDNYTSMVFRVTLHGVKRTLDPDGNEIEELWTGSIIYKRLPENQLRREAFKSDELFRNEVAFYTKVWPALSQFQEKWNIRHPLRCIPKCYLARDDMVVLKDLKQLGFVMPDRRQGLTIEQCYFVLKHLSQFHALSLAMKHHDPKGFEKLTREITEVFYVPENVEFFRNYYREAARNAVAMVDLQLKDDDNKDHYLQKFQDFCSEGNFFRIMVETVHATGPLAVICHGDTWTNNLLFRYVDGDLAEMFIVDFQIARYGSPALDLVYLMYLCLDREQRSHHLTSLLEYYTDELHRSLVELSDAGSVFHNQLNRDALFEMLQEEFKRCSRFGLGTALDMYPIMTCNSSEAPNLYQAKESDSAQTHESLKPVWTTNEICRKKMTDLVQELVDGGLL